MSDTIRFNMRAAQRKASAAEERHTRTGRIVHDARGNAIFLLAGENVEDVGASGLLRRLDVPGLSLEGEVRRLGADRPIRAANSPAGFNPYNHTAADTARVHMPAETPAAPARADDGGATTLIRRLLKVR